MEILSALCHASCALSRLMYACLAVAFVAVLRLRTRGANIYEHVKDWASRRLSSVAGSPSD